MYWILMNFDSISSFEGPHIIFWIGARACLYSRVVSRSPAHFLRAVCFPFLGFLAAPSCLLGRMLLRWSGFSWFSLDSKNSDRTPIWIVCLVRSLADRTFQLNSGPNSVARLPSLRTDLVCSSSLETHLPSCPRRSVLLRSAPRDQRVPPLRYPAAIS